MSENQNVHGINESNAVLLLAAAEELGLDQSVVATTTSGYFIVPVEVAKQAGFDENGLPDGKAANKAAKTEQEKADELQAARDADAAAAADAAETLKAETTGNPDGRADGGDGDDEGTEGDGVLRGEALAQALKDRGLPATGSADEKRAAVAEYDENKGA